MPALARPRPGPPVSSPSTSATPAIQRAWRPRDRALVGRAAQPGERILAHRLEHVEARLAVGAVAAHEQALVAERRDAVEHVPGAGRRRRHGLRRVEREPADEHRELAEERLLVGREQAVAPVDDVAQRAVARLDVTRIGAQQVEALVEAPADGARREHPRARRRKLEGERQPVEPAAHRRDVGRVLVGQREVGAAGARPLHEQPHRLGFADGRRPWPRSAREGRAAAPAAPARRGGAAARGW
jgi:hypothetical protein